jgi:ABC-2 type transport system permease protein
MRSKASYFSVSKPLIIENLRRFWAIPTLAFLLYFLSGVFPILMSYSHLDDLSGYVRMSLANQQPFYMFAHLLFPIIAAVVIFRYLQGVSSVSMMHSMPFTRAKLYNSGFLSGLILIGAPILANGLIMLAISKPVYNQYYSETGLMTEGVNLFGRTAILNWIWVSLLIAFVIYAVSVFAGIVTGNGLMHFATAGCFNFLIPALYGIFIVYFSKFLYGFDTSANLLEYGLKTSPFLHVLQSNGVFGPGIAACYIAGFLILYGVSAFLYQRRKLERAMDTLVFGFMEVFICYLIAFLGMTFLGFYFEALGQSAPYFYGGLAAGTAIFFIIGQMIVKKTPRIYNMKSLKSAGIYVLIATLFLLGLNFDLTGFERRVPAPAKIDSFILDSGFSREYPFSMYLNAAIYKNSDGGIFIMKDPGNKEAVTALHRSVIEEKSRFFSGDIFGGSNGRDYTETLYLRYNPDAARTMTRRYQVDYDFVKNSAAFKQIYESAEFKGHFSPSNLNYTSLNQIDVNSDLPYRDTLTLRRPAEMQEFLACLAQDFEAQPFEDMISLRRPHATTTINFKYKDENSDTPERLRDGNLSYPITENYTNTLRWLSEHGYDGRFTPNAGEVAFIEMYRVQRSQWEAAATLPMEEREPAIISEPAQIQALLDNYETRATNYDDHYYGVVVWQGGGELPSDQEYLDRYGYVPEAAEKYVLDSSRSTLQIYFNEGNVPDFLPDYFQ